LQGREKGVIVFQRFMVTLTICGVATFFFHGSGFALTGMAGLPADWRRRIADTTKNACHFIMLVKFISLYWL
jgi:hypothetical protein